MVDAPNVQVKVRLQARGGKFLGPKVTPPTLLVRVAGTNDVLFSGTFDNSASGTVVSTPSPTSSRNTIVVQPVEPAQFYPAAGAYALEPPAGEAQLVAAFTLDVPAAVEFVATVSEGLTVSTTLQLWPGLQLLDDPGVVLTIPGLLVNVLSASYGSGNVSVTASVQMMCGCPITPQPWTTPPDTEPYWPSYEFQVWATMAGTTIPLSCTETNTFTGAASLTLDPGTYDVAVMAVQLAESNSGFATSSLEV